MKPIAKYLTQIHFKTFCLTVVLTCCLIPALHAQLYVTNYGFLGVGVGTESLKPINLEARIGTNNKIGSTLFEFVGYYHLMDAPHHSLSGGLGFNIDLFNEANFSLIVPFELEIFPAPNFRQIALTIELGPEFQFAFDEVYLRHIWGIRYYFSEPD